MELTSAYRVFGAMVLAGLIWPFSSCQASGESAAQQGPLLNVVAHIEPCLSIELSDTGIGFHADKGPGAYDADKSVDVRVATNYGSWTLSCLANPLVGDKGTIGAERVFLTGKESVSVPDSGAGPGYVSLGSNALIADGGPQALTVVDTMRFRLKTEWTDRPGQYTGTISFTFLATP